MSRICTPHFEDVQSHYDLSDDFYRLFLDPTQTYSCAYFERDDMTLEEAQFAKIDLSLGKLGLQPGMTLLDIGCGWGATMMRAVRDLRRQRHRADAVGESARPRPRRRSPTRTRPRSKRVLLQGWEQFDEPVDRIVSIGAFEHFGHDRYDDFFKMAYRALPDDGVMLLHTITRLTLDELKERDIPLTMDAARFASFIAQGDLPRRPVAVDRGGRGPRRHRRLHGHPYPVAAAALRADAGHLGGGACRRSRDEAIAVQSEVVYDRYMKYLTGCADMFRKGYIDVNQFTLAK